MTEQDETCPACREACGGNVKPSPFYARPTLFLFLVCVHFQQRVYDYRQRPRDLEGKDFFGFFALGRAQCLAVRQAIVESIANVPLCTKCWRIVMFLTVATTLLGIGVIIGIWRAIAG